MDILIVEDEPEIAQLIQMSLEKEGFSCRISSDGLNALRMFQEQSPDLIILDLMIPGLDGLEVCARIRHKPGAKDPYILMLTAKGEEIDRVIGLSTGADDYMVKPFSPRELIARVRTLLRRSLRHGSQTLVLADIDRTEQVLVNLVGNAVRYTTKGSITLRTWAEAFKLWIAVIDTGTGIAKEDLPYVFERFWRADKSRDRHSGGTGIGSPISRRLVELQGGQISVESQLGSGSTFRFFLPLA